MSHDTENLMADLKKLRDEAEETDFFSLHRSLFENVVSCGSDYSRE